MRMGGRRPAWSRCLPVAVALTIAGVYAASAAPAAAPNVVLVSIDTLRADHCSAYGYAKETTPRLERLAREGVQFDTAYTPMPTTGPAHASLLTARYPRSHGVLKNGHVLAADRTTLAEVLERAGYDTIAVVSSFVLHDRFGFAQGFARYDDRFPPTRVSAPVSEFRKDIDIEGGFYRQARDTTNQAIARLRARSGDRPFFLWVHYFDPHQPYDPPAEYVQALARSDRGGGATADASGPGDERLRRQIAAYDAEIRYTDHEIGRLLDHLDEEVGRERTLVVVTADHGEGLMQHGWMGHGVHLHEELVRVALLLRWPGHVPAGRRLAAPVGLIDVAPTILGLLEIPPGDLAAQGIDLSPAVRGAGTPAADRPMYFQRRSYKTPTHNGRDTRYPMFAIRQGRWKYVEDGPGAALYDLESDPGELTDVRASEPQVAATLARELRAWHETEEKLPPQHAIAPEDGERLRALGYVE